MCLFMYLFIAYTVALAQTHSKLKFFKNSMIQQRMCKAERNLTVFKFFSWILSGCVDLL